MQIISSTYIWSEWLDHSIWRFKWTVNHQSRFCWRRDYISGIPNCFHESNYLKEYALKERRDRKRLSISWSIKCRIFARRSVEPQSLEATRRLIANVCLVTRVSMLKRKYGFERRRLYFRKRFEEAKGRYSRHGCELKARELFADKEAAAREPHPIHN